MYGFVRMYVSVNHINPQNIRTFLKKIKSFSKKNKSFFEKITGFFKSVLAFLPLPGILLYFVEICTLFASKKTRTPYFTSSWNSLKKEVYITESKHVIQKSASKRSEGIGYK